MPPRKRFAVTVAPAPADRCACGAEGSAIFKGVRYCPEHAPSDFMPAARKQVSPSRNFRAPGPSADAARSNTCAKQRIKFAAYDILKIRAATAEEIAKELGEDITSVRPRLTDLKDEGRIAPSRVRRSSNMGGTSGVWVLASRLEEFERANGVDDRKQGRAA